MNIRFLSIVGVVCLILLSGCDKPSGVSGGASNDEKKPLSAVPFNGETFRSFDGGTVLTLISKEECEKKEGSETFLCKYTQQDGAIRVVMTKLGTNLVDYFRRIPAGLEDKHGQILLNPLAYTAAVKKVEAQKLALQQMQEAAERQRVEQERQRAEQERKKREEHERIGKIIDRSKVETKTLYRTKVMGNRGTLRIGLEISDAYLKRIADGGDPFDPIWIGAVRNFNFQTQGNKVTLKILYYHDRHGLSDDSVEFSSIPEWEKFSKAYSAAEKEWNERFPELKNPVIDAYFGW